MILLSKAYGGYAAGTIAQFSTTIEASLIASNYGVTSAGPVSTGAVSTTMPAGRVAIAAAASSVVVTNPQVTTESKIFAVVAQAAADGTLLRVERVVPAAGSFTIYGTANATATTTIDWAILGPFGGMTSAA